MDENFHKDKNQRYDKMFTKYFMGGGDFHVGKLTPIPQGKKKIEYRKNYLLGKM